MGLTCDFRREISRYTSARAAKIMKLYLEEFSEEELLEIFGLFCSSNDMVLSESAEQALKAYLAQLCLEKPENFANGREMRNLFETALSNQANRLAELTSITDDELNEITTEDLAIL